METDSVEYSIAPEMLGEIVVKASPVITKVDRKVIRPDKAALRSSADALDLLRKLSLPGLTVNPLTHAVSLTGGGEVMFCVNGVESTPAQISAILPADILRVEYLDNPGVRYPGMSAVINYVTVRDDSGGHLSLDAFGAFAKGRYASIDHFSGQYNRGCAVWSAAVGFMGQHKNRWVRDYDETWHYPGTTVERHETGLPVSVGGAGMESVVNYNRLSPSGNMINIRVGCDYDNVPNQEEGDRRALLETSGSDRPVIVTEHTEERFVKPNVGFYYMHRFSEQNSLMLDVQGAYQNSRMFHEYSENGISEAVGVTGDKYSVKFVGMYESRRRSGIWTVGISNASSLISNTYRQDVSSVVRVFQSETALDGEYSMRRGNWGARGVLRLAHRNLSQSHRQLNRLFILPSASVSYQCAGYLFFRYTASLDYVMPSAAEVSDIVQPIQTGMVRCGNPALQPFRVVDQSFKISFEHPIIGLEGRVEYRNEHKPVMESVIFENGGFVRTYFNQRSFQRLTAGASVQIRPWKNHNLTFSAEPVLTRYFSHGNDYRHCCNIFRVGLGVDFSYRHLIAYGNIISGPANRMYGEEIIEEKDMNQVMVGYKGDAWSLHVGVFNAFMKNYWMETRNLSALAPYTSKAHSSRSSSYVAVKFNLSLDFGHKVRTVDLSTPSLDNDSGILTGTK